MKTYNNILQQIQISENLEKLISSKVATPILDDYNSPYKYWYPHPPCLIPLFLGYGASYKGIIHHFFCKRKNTFFEYFLENGYFSEIARNENQFYTIMILRMIVIKDNISDDIIRFCKEINYTQLERVNDFSIKYGDNLNKYQDLVYYNQDTPLKYINKISEYNGDFPSSLTILNLKELNNACSFEISNKDFLNNIEIPIWMRNDISKKELFNDFISKGLLKEAWFTLNSKGWMLNEVAESLLILKGKNNDQLLHLIADNWINNWEKSDFKENAYY